MGMTIDEHIGVIEDLKNAMSVCMPEPEKTEICASLSEARDTMRKYQKIEEIVGHYGFESSWLCLRKIREVMEE